MGSFGVFSPYHQPNAIQATAAKPVLIKQAPVSTESVTPVENPVEQSPTTPPTNPSEISLESHLRNAWNNVKPVEETLVETSSPPVITASDLTPTTNKGAKEASSSEEMLAMEARVIPMANSIGKAFDHARQMETVAAAGGAPPVKGYRPLKFVGSRRIIDTKLLAELIKSWVLDELLFFVKIPWYIFYLLRNRVNQLRRSTWLVKKASLFSFSAKYLGAIQKALSVKRKRKDDLQIKGVEDKEGA
jgi:hypothetical protein